MLKAIDVARFIVDAVVVLVWLLGLLLVELLEKIGKALLGSRPVL